MSTNTLPRAAAVTDAGSRLSTDWLPLCVLLAGTFMSVLDFFIVNVAMPAIQGSLHASASSLEWVVAGYGLSSSVLLVAGGRLGDRYGRRRIFACGLALFTLSSALCGVAPSMPLLIVGRIAQGIGGALFTTNVISLIGVLYTGERRTRAMASYGMVLGVAAVGGQLLGGTLLALDPLHLGWRCCFLINLPIGVAALAAATRLIPESRGKLAQGLDLSGLGLITLTLTAIVFPLVQGREAHWATWIWLILAAAPFLLAAYLLQQRRLRSRGGTPLLELSLLRIRSFRATLAAQTLFWCGQASFFLILALYLQSGRGLTPLQSGLMFMALAGTYLITSTLAPGLAARHGGKPLITSAALLLVAGHATLITTVALTGTSESVLWIIPALMMIGAGMGLAIAPLATGMMATLKPEQAGSAAGVLSTAQYVGNSLGVALVGVAFFGALSGGYTHALEHGLVVLVVILGCVAGLARFMP
jgi:EmrB/QacA subfamily drug resistance transporter